MKLIVFIDIDGTILYQPKDPDDFPETLDGQYVCDGLEQFLEFTVEHCEPYWLSYRARLGKRDILDAHILPHLPPIAKEVGIAHWDEFKHEALPTDQPFLWFDDYPEPEDEAWLRQQGFQENLIRVDCYEKESPRIMLETLRAAHSAIAKR